MRVLIGCERSGRVRDAFAALGHDAWSCDLEPSDTPGQHYQGDVRDILYDAWDMLIAFMPCTYLTVTGNRWMKPEYASRYPTRVQDRKDAIDFFMLLVNAPIRRIGAENPIGIMSTVYRKPDQIIQPYWFGDPHRKSTCLWLKNLPLLKPTNIVEPEYKVYRAKNKRSGFSKYPMAWTGTPDARIRSNTFPGVARAMAEQWGNLAVTTRQLALMEWGT
jgi:hypothetical protein